MTMSHCSLTVLAATALISSTTAYAKSPSGPPAATSPEAETEINVIAKKLCKADPVIGTRIVVKRKCDTPAQLAAYQRQAREMIENYRRRPCMAGAESGNNQAMQC
jgi:hypothetical protein